VTKSDNCFIVTNITAGSPPVKGQFNTLHVCAIVSLLNDRWTGTLVEIGANYGSKDNVVYEAGNQYHSDDPLPVGISVCEDFKFRILSYYDSALYVRLYFHDYSRNDMTEVIVELYF